MRIGLIDCDSKNSKNLFPNLSLMKLSAWHKAQGDYVEWYEPMFSGHMDRVYMSKVFSFSPDYQYNIDAEEIIYGGSGYAIELRNGIEVYDKKRDGALPYEIEHIYPDYGIYGIEDTAYGFLSRGCPRDCGFCHVTQMQGCKSIKVADLSEFWDGQKEIKLLDPNITACSEWSDLFDQLIESGARVDFTQGLDIRTMTEQKIEKLKLVKTKHVHFAWDRYEDKNVVYPKIVQLARATGWKPHRIIVYVLVGDRERKVTQQDLERIYLLREIAYPYVMIYDKQSLPRGHELRKLQRWVNNRIIWKSIDNFEEYLESKI